MMYYKVPCDFLNNHLFMEISSRPSITDMAAMVIRLIAPILEAYEATKPPILATKLLQEPNTHQQRAQKQPEPVWLP